jgi:DNA-binding transcriptional ArsR family regulator
MPEVTPSTQGDVDIAAVAVLFADRTRARILSALGDGRSLPATVLASEAGVSAQAASGQLARLVEAGLLSVERTGRNRYYRLATGHVANVLEVLAQLAPMQPVTSLRQSTRANAVREARTCYDHLAGRLGIQITQALIDTGALASTDGIPDNRRRAGDLVSTQMSEHPYVLGPAAVEVFGRLGVEADALADDRSRRPLLRFCMDWSEQCHHLAGRLGALLCTAFLEAGWITRTPVHRAIRLTDEGRHELHARLGLAGVVTAAEGTHANLYK